MESQTQELPSKADAPKMSSAAARYWDACCRGNEAEALAAVKDLTEYEVSMNFFNTVRRASQNRLTKVVQQLAEDFKITKDAIHASDAFPYSCEKGNLELATWIVEKYEFVADEARTCSDWALKGSAENGYIEVVKWLISKFQITKSDISMLGHWCLHRILKNGHFNVFKFLLQIH